MLLILIGEILLIAMRRGANNIAEQRDMKTEKGGDSIRQHHGVSTALQTQELKRMNSSVRFACVRYTKYVLEIVSKVHVKYFLFIMKY